MRRKPWAGCLPGAASNWSTAAATSASWGSSPTPAWRPAGRSSAVIPEALLGKEVAGRHVDHRALTRLEVVASMHARKARMAELADGFIALPGGFGTFEEFCEILTWGQLGFHVKPTGLLNVNGFYDPLLAMFDRAVEDGFLRAENRAMALAAGDGESLLAAMAAYRPEPVSKWLKETQQL
jgi:uncharacterized protein (TIGR00730 family)